MQTSALTGRCRTTALAAPAAPSRAARSALGSSRIRKPHTPAPRCRSAASASPALAAGAPFQWSYETTEFTVPVDEAGTGAPLLVLPAVSTVSTRAELTSLISSLGDGYQITTLDWPGFGGASRPAMKYSGEVLYAFLKDFVAQRFSAPIRVVACGHSASYAIRLAAEVPSAVSHVALVAPTWAGPFRVMNVNPAVRGAFAGALTAPVVGRALFSNVISSEANLVKQYKSHVFTGESLLTDDFIAAKAQVTSHPNARFAAASFVTGGLDVAESREEVLEMLGKATAKVLLVKGDGTPKRTSAEMDAMAGVPGVELAAAPGSLGMHEEFGSEVAQAVLPFLKE